MRFRLRNSPPSPPVVSALGRLHAAVVIDDRDNGSPQTLRPASTAAASRPASAPPSACAYTYAYAASGR